MAALAATLKLEEADAYRPAQELFDSIKSHLQTALAHEMTHSELENYLSAQGRELMRRMLQGHLNERGPGAVADLVVDANKQPHQHKRLHSRSLISIFGPVTLSRLGYYGPGIESLHPLDAGLNLPPEKYSHTFQRWAAVETAKGSFDEVVLAMQDKTGKTQHKRQAEQSVRRSAQDFDSFYDQRRVASAPEVEHSGPILVISLDSKGIPMRRADLREETRKAAEVQTPRLAHRRSKGEKGHNKRMSTVATVYTIDPFVRTPQQIACELQPIGQSPAPRPRPENKRVWASVKHLPEKILEQAFEEASRRDPQQHKQWVALVDGNRSQLKLLEAKAKKDGVKLRIILDLIHVLEYLWKAAWALHGEGEPAAESWVQQRLLSILGGGSSQVAAGLTRLATRRQLSPKQRAPLDTCAKYLLKHRDFLRYDKYLAAGYPIATGVIEGACRYLVKDRMEVTGARWSLAGAEAVLQLRSLRASGDFDQYWDFHLQQEYKRNHVARYAMGKVPIPVPLVSVEAKSTQLRLVR